MQRRGVPARAAVAASAALALVLLAGCGHHRPQALAWRARSLPVPAGERAMVRDAVWCHDRWAVVGATANAAGATRPAVWVSGDGSSWQTLRLDPRGDYYAARAILYSVACHAGRLAVLGAQSGGAHGLPRTATWRPRADGSLVAVRAPYVRYGGTRAVAVSRLAGGAQGYLIAGTRTDGAAVWTSPTGDRFVLHQGLRGLADTPRSRTEALAAVAWGGRWVLTGIATDDAGRVAGVTWTGAGSGPWTRRDLPGGRTISTADRAVLTGSGPLVAGLLDQRFGLWRQQGRGWHLAGGFGERDAGDTSAAYVSGLAWTGSRLLATYSDGARFRLAVGGVSGLQPSALPASVSVSGDHTVTVVAHGSRALLLTDDGHRGRVWLARVPAPGS